MSNINDMLVFLAVVEAGSFTNAADRLGIPKANVSRKLARLEERLGIRLLERTTRAQHLTEAGRRYLNHCKRIQEEVDLAEAAVAEELTVYRGPLRIGASVAVGQQLIRPELANFMSKYPDLEVQLNLINRRVDLIEEGFDLLIRIGDLEDSSLIARPLGRVRRKLFAAPSYANKEGLPADFDDLGEHKILFMGNIQGKHSIELKQGQKTKHLDIRPRLLADDFSVVKQGVLDGMGIGLFPEYMCSEEVQQGSLLAVLPEWATDPVSICALYPQHRAKIPKVKAFLEFISGIFERRVAS